MDVRSDHIEVVTVAAHSENEAEHAALRALSGHRLARLDVVTCARAKPGQYRVVLRVRTVATYAEPNEAMLHTWPPTARAGGRDNDAVTTTPIGPAHLSAPALPFGS